MNNRNLYFIMGMKHGYVFILCYEESCCIFTPMWSALECFPSGKKLDIFQLICSNKGFYNPAIQILWRTLFLFLLLSLALTEIFLLVFRHLFHWEE